MGTNVQSSGLWDECRGMRRICFEPRAGRPNSDKGKPPDGVASGGGQRR